MGFLINQFNPFLISADRVLHFCAMYPIIVIPERLKVGVHEEVVVDPLIFLKSNGVPIS